MTHGDSRPETKAEAAPPPPHADANGSAFSSGLRIWQQETSRFLEELIRQDRATLDRLCECKSPLEVLSVEQEWVRARSRSYLESGLRFAQAFAAISRASDADDAEATMRGPPASARHEGGAAPRP